MSKPVLFRKEVESTQRDGLGEIIAWTPPQLKISAVLLLLTFVGATIGLLRLEYAEKVSVAGKVQPEAKIVAVLSPAQGAVSEVYARLGDTVERGDVIAIIDRRAYGDRLGSRQHYRKLDLQQQTALAGEALQHSAVFNRAQLESIRLEISRLNESAERLADRRALVHEEFQLAQAHWSRIERLQQDGWIGATAANEVRSVYLGLKARVLEVEDRVAQTQSAIRAETQEMRTITLGNQIERTRLQSRLLELQSRLNEVEQAEREIVIAPVSGRIADIGLMAGDHVNQGASLLKIAPVSARNKIELLLTSQAAGRIKAGMLVRLRYAGYPHHKFGAVSGRISTVNDVHIAGQAVYRAYANLLTVPPEIRSAPAGMTVQADVILESRTLWQWLSRPVKDALARV